MTDETFYCDMCLREVPWSEGADDDMPKSCDDCWALMHEDEEPT
jgi:hypothetical protein